MIENLIEDILSLLENESEVNQDFIESMNKDIGAAVANAIKEGNSGGGRRLRPSNFGKECKRALWYDLNAPKPISAELKMRFLTGHILEAVLLCLVKHSGHTVTKQQHEVALHGMKGHTDALIDDVLIDVKTASKFSWEKFKKAGLSDDSFGYKQQLSFYANALGKDEAYLFIMNKNSSELQLVNCEVVNVQEDVNEAKRIVASKEPPPIPYSLEDTPNKEIPVKCRFCDHKKDCWKEMRTFKYSSGLKYFAEINKLPRVEEVTDNEL